MSFTDGITFRSDGSAIASWTKPPKEDAYRFTTCRNCGRDMFIPTWNDAFGDYLCQDCFVRRDMDTQREKDAWERGRADAEAWASVFQVNPVLDPMKASKLAIQFAGWAGFNGNLNEGASYTQGWLAGIQGQTASTPQDKANQVLDGILQSLNDLNNLARDGKLLPAPGQTS